MRRLRPTWRRVPGVGVKSPAFFTRLFCLSLLLLLTPTACTFTIGTTYTQISGTVYGDSVSLQEQGTSKSVPLHGATVRCGNVSTKSNANGYYSLQVKQRKSYDCVASSPLYESQDDSLDLVHGPHLVLNFGPSTQSLCSTSPTSAITENCQLLDLDGGSLAGTVTAGTGGKPIKNAIVKCVMIDPDSLASPVDSSDGVTTTTDADGTFNLSGVAVGPYTCLSFNKGQTTGRQLVTVAPSVITSTQIVSCFHNCHAVTFHGGSVMRTLTAYLIFWLPPGYTFGPGGSNSYYESRLKQFFADLQGTRYFELLTQYWDYEGSIQDQVTLGGSYVDKTPYEHCEYTGLDCSRAAGSDRDPLLDNDIEGEINRALQANPGWSVAQTHEFFVFTGNGVQECESDKPGVNCTYTSGPKGFCAYHSFFSNTSDDESPPYIYAYVPAPSTQASYYGCTAQNFGFYGAMPGGDPNVDMAINFTSHEMFESITDPLYNSYDPSSDGWFDDAVDAKDPGEGEIADLCFSTFGQIGSDGGNVTLKHGHRYIVQAEWSNLTNRCSLG